MTPPKPTRLVVAITPLLVDREQAAALLGVSPNHYDEHVRPHLPVVYSGKLRRWRVRDLECWAEASAMTPPTSRA